MQRSFFLLALFFSVTLTVLFFHTLPFPFTNYDDDLLILENRKLHQPSWNNLKRVLWGFEDIAYQPIQDISFMVDYYFWGQKHPEGFRVTNLLLYLLNIQLFFLFAQKFLKHRGFSGLATLLFALHPTHVESIVWIAGRKDLLAGFFGLLCFLCWLRSDKLSQLWALVFFLLALGSKPNMVFWPLLGHLYLRIAPNIATLSKKTIWIAWMFTIPFFVLFFLLANKNQALVEYHGGTPLATFYTMSAVYLDYATLLFWPQSLSHYYEPPIYTQLHWKSLLGLLIFLASVSCFLWSWKKRHPLCFFLGCFLGMLLPYANFLPISILMANRYLYFSGMGLFLGMVFLLRFSRAVWFLFGVAILWGFWSYQHSFLWQNSVYLWEQASTRYPQSEKILASLGAAYLQEAIHSFDERRIEYWNKAVPLFQKIIERSTQPGNRLRAFFNLGVIACSQQNVESAYGYFERAEQEIHFLNTRPLSLLQKKELSQIQANIYCSKGDLCIQAGDLAQGAKWYRRAIQECPTQAQPYVTLASILSRTDRLSEAYQELDRALEVDPNFVLALHTKGILLMSEPLEDPAQAARRDQKAKQLFERVLALQPDHVEAHFQLAMSVQPTDLKKFEQQLQKVLTIDPEYREAHRFLLRFYLQKTKRDPTAWEQMKPHVDFFQKRVDLDPSLQEELLQYYSILAKHKLSEAQRLKQEEGSLSEKSKLLWEEAGALFSSILKIKTDSLEAYYGKVECALGLNDEERALSFLHQIHRIAPQEHRVLKHLGYLYLSRKEYLQAIYYFQEYKKHPNSDEVDAFLILSLQKEMEEKVNEACIQAKTCLKNAQLEEAEKFLKEALQMNPKHAESNYLLSQIATLKQQWKESLAFLEITLSTQDGRLPPEVFYDLGFVCLRLDQPDRALEALEKYRSLLHPNDTKQLAEVARYLEYAKELKSKKMQQAQELVRDALQALHQEQKSVFLEKTEALFKLLPYSPELKLFFCKELLFQQEYQKANDWLQQEINERVKKSQTQAMGLPVLTLSFLDRERFPVVLLMEAYLLLENPTETNILKSKFFLLQIQKAKEVTAEERSLLAQMLNDIKDSSTRNIGKIRDQLKGLIEQLLARV